MAQVQRLREECEADPALGSVLRQIKALQSRRFELTYADLLNDAATAPAARFFLDELYGVRDFSQRDQQFTRIAHTLERLFPQTVVATAVQLAELHALTETLDMAMACVWRGSVTVLPGAAHADTHIEPGDAAQRYLHCWRTVGAADERARQLQWVRHMGESLARLRRHASLRTLLRMMRAPARAAGLSALQAFLEAGFDTFGALARQRGGVERFLDTITEREAGWMQRWYAADTVAAETQLRALLAQGTPPPGLP